MEQVKAIHAILIMVISTPFSAGVAWTTVKLTQKFTEKRVKALEDFKTSVEKENKERAKEERDKIDRLARIETKLDLILEGKLNTNKD